MTYPTAAPGNYDGGQSITVNPVEIDNHATSLNSTIDAINGHMKKISDTWKSLKLGWAGQTKTEVDDFNKQWLSAVTEMFGDPKTDPDSKEIPPEGQAALGKIQMLVKGAAHNYASAEDSLCQNLLEYGDNLPGGDHTITKDNVPDGKDLPKTIPRSDKPPTGGDDGGARDYDEGPIMEHNKKK